MISLYRQLLSLGQFAAWNQIPTTTGVFSATRVTSRLRHSLRPTVTRQSYKPSITTSQNCTPPTGDRARQEEHRRQRADSTAEHCAECPLGTGHFGLIRPHATVATFLPCATANERRKLLLSSCSSAPQLLLLLLQRLTGMMLMYSYGCRGRQRHLTINARNRIRGRNSEILVDVVKQPCVHHFQSAYTAELLAHLRLASDSI